MIDISQTTAPKSDQLNADDLVGGPATLLITGVRIVEDDQPVLIDYQGGEGRPYKPCKSMRRVLVLAWGNNGEDYIGRSMVVYNDPTVKWAGADVGGIRISHLSHIKNKMRIMLTVTRGKRVPYTVDVLNVFTGNPLTVEEFERWSKEIDEAGDMATISEIASRIKAAQYDESGAAQVRSVYTAAVERIRKNESGE